MKKQDLDKLRDQSKKELESLLEKLARELAELRMQFSLGKLKNVKTMSGKRKDIAQVKTIIHEQKLFGGAEPEDKKS